jgi:hypothetical protein
MEHNFILPLKNHIRREYKYGVDCRALIPTKCHAIVPMSDRGRPGSFHHQA